MHEYREFTTRQQRIRSVWTRVLWVIVLALCIALAMIARPLLQPTPNPTATPTPTTVAPPPPANTAPPPLPTATPTSTEAPTEAPAVQPTPTTTPSPLPIPPSDAQADIVSYADLAPVEAFPNGVDIRAASVGADLGVTLQPTGDVPAELPRQAAGEVLLWIVLSDPVPDPPTSYTEWLFVLDLDGDINTGRPAGSLRTNPDLGIEVAIGAYFDPAVGEYDAYSLVWDPEQAGWANGPAGLHLVLGEGRTVVGLALPMETLTESAVQVAGVTLVPDAVRGRAAALAVVEARRVIDFYPERAGE